MEALAINRDAAVTMKFLSFWGRRLVDRTVVGSLFVLFAAVPPRGENV